MKNRIQHPAIFFNLSDSEGQVHRLSELRESWLLLIDEPRAIYHACGLAHLLPGYMRAKDMVGIF
jgi:hypothetical protein